MELLTAGTPLLKTGGPDEACSIKKQVGAYGLPHENAVIKAHGCLDVFQDWIIGYVAE